jgi:hypothetical protein
MTEAHRNASAICEVAKCPKRLFVGLKALICECHRIIRVVMGRASFRIFVKRVRYRGHLFRPLLRYGDTVVESDDKAKLFVDHLAAQFSSFPPPQPSKAKAHLVPIFI